MGGGGLVQLPALLLGLPAASPVEVLATNKLASICGTTVSSATYYRRIRPDPKTFLPLMLLAFVGSAAGAAVAFLIPRDAFDPIVLVALIVVGAYVVFKPTLGGETELRFSGHRHTAAAMLTGLGIGFYDGALGPAPAASSCSPWSGCSATRSWRPPPRPAWRTGPPTSRALCVFVPQGVVLWKVGLLMGVCNLAGGYLGARTAVARGAGFVRVFFIVVVSAFIIRIGGDVLGIW